MIIIIFITITIIIITIIINIIITIITRSLPLLTLFSQDVSDICTRGRFLLTTQHLLPTYLRFTFVRSS